MNIERLLQISIGALTVLGPLLLGASDGFPALPVWVAIAVATSFLVTDVLGWVRLNRTVTNLASVGAVLLSLGEILDFRAGGDVQPIARLLAYLQVILLFQKKDFRAYWQLAVLSLLQVLVATAFNHGFSFGLLLVAYLFVSIATLALLFLYREQELAHRRSKKSPEWQSKADWTSISNRPEFFGSRRAAPSGVGVGFWWRLARIVLGSLLLSALIFSAVPRLGSGAWYGRGLSLQNMVGFSDTVRLGALGSVIENPREVFIAKFAEFETSEPYEVNDGVYFRGAALAHYGDGRWEAHARGGYSRSRSGSTGGRVRLGMVTPLVSEGLIRQTITIQPLNRKELFFVWPVVAVVHDDRLSVDLHRQRLLREEGEDTEFTYELGTTAFADHEQRRILPEDDGFDPSPLLAMPSQGGESEIPELIRTAEQWLQERDLPVEDRYRRALWLEHMFRDTGEFEYSLEGQVRAASIDPIEDFVKNNRRGHCEYFATALALMLRSQGIPARVMVGFKTNEWNEVGQFYQVRQLHAHAWVEAYLRPQEVPPDTLNADRPWQWMHGAWLRLDPTPSARELEIENAKTIWTKMDGYLKWLDYAWSNYVMRMDKPLQEKTIYDPAADTLKTFWRNLTDGQWWRGLWQRVTNPFGSWLARYFGGHWFSWGGLLATTVILGTASLIYATARRLWRWRTGAAPSGKGAAGSRVRVEFYRQLEAALARFGLRRPATQTQREFARRARDVILELPDAADVAHLPAAVTEAFYRVRFGGSPLDKDQRAAVESALADLAQAAVARTNHENRVGRVSGVGQEHAV